MNDLLVGLIGVLVSTNPVAATSNLVAETTGIAVQAPDANDPVEQEFRRLEEADDVAMQEVDDWIRENEEFKARGGGIPNAELNRRIRKRLALVAEAWADFIRRHPDHARARLAYASFLHDTGDEEGEIEHLEKARGLDPSNPAVWNNLANYYGHRGPVTNAFAYYQKAITLDGQEPVYYHNFGTTVFLFRKDAREYFRIDEQQVFDKALELYAHALRLDPTNFALASDVALTYYGIRPTRTQAALVAWTNALNVAPGEAEREAVYIHLARVKMGAGLFQESHAHLNAVTNAIYSDLKRRLLRNLSERESGTNPPPASTDGKAAPALVD